MTPGQRDGTVIYELLPFTGQSRCETSRPCGEQAGAGGADVELTVCAGQPPGCRPGPTPAGRPGARSAREQGPCSSRAESAKPEPHGLLQVPAQPRPERAPGGLRAAEGRCLWVISGRRPAVEDTGRGTHRSATRRPLEGCREWVPGIGCKKVRQLGSPPALSSLLSHSSPVPLVPSSLSLSLCFCLSLCLSPCVCLKVFCSLVS